MVRPRASSAPRAERRPRRRVSPGVGARFLHDAIGVAACRRRCDRYVDAGVDTHAGGGGLGNERRQMCDCLALTAVSVRTRTTDSQRAIHDAARAAGAGVLAIADPLFATQLPRRSSMPPLVARHPPSPGARANRLGSETVAVGRLVRTSRLARIATARRHSARSRPAFASDRATTTLLTRSRSILGIAETISRATPCRSSSHRPSAAPSVLERAIRDGLASLWHHRHASDSLAPAASA